jgi:hypothetical protein
MPVTTNPEDPRLGKGIDEISTGQNEAYLVLSEEERAKGFIRPYRESYQHVGKPAVMFPLQDLTDEQKEHYPEYVKYEKYPESMSPKMGKYYTQAELDSINKGCGTVTTMNRAIAETYARSPHFYGATYCTGCQKHLPVSEFIWLGTDERVGS